MSTSPATRADGLRGMRWAGLLLVVAILWFGFIGLRDLYFPDEGRYAEIPREMLASGDWVTPRINAFGYFEKPPLQYWISAAIFAVAGESNVTARLWPALAGFGAMLAVLVTARRVFSRRAAWMAGAVMASSCGYFLSSQFITLDMSLTAWLTGALCAFLLAQRGGVAPRDERRWMLAAWAACALAVLTKGAVGVVIPALALVAYVAATRDRLVLRRLHIGAGMLVFALIAVPWFIAVEQRNPGFAHFFFVTEHFDRFTQPDHNRRGPWWYYIPIAIVMLTPWGPAIAASGLRKRGAADVASNGFDARRFLWCWALALFLFFSLSSSKLPAYILPAMGAVALAAAGPLARRWSLTLRVTAWASIATGVMVAAAAVPAGRFINVPMVREAYASSVGWMIVAGIVFALAGGLTLVLVRQRRRVSALATLVVGILVACQLGVVLAHEVDGYFSAGRLLTRVSGGQRPFRPDLPFYSVGSFDHTVPFYLGRTVTLVGDKGELASAIAADPANYLTEFAQFTGAWSAIPDGYAIMQAAIYDSLREAGLPMRLVDTDGRRVVVARR